MNNNQALTAVTSEIDDVVGSRGDGDDVIRLSMDDVDSLPVLGMEQCRHVCLYVLSTDDMSLQTSQLSLTRQTRGGCANGRTLMRFLGSSLR